MNRFEHTTAIELGDWIAPRLRGDFGAVGRVCPTGFEAYARVFHPVETGDAPLTWAEVCAATGSTPHPLMQWGLVSGVSYGERLFGDWDGGEPRTGDLGAVALAVLTAAIGGDTPVTIGVWDGYGGGRPIGPTLALPGRDYVLFRGTLGMLRGATWEHGMPRETVNLLWPDDESWFVASEIDFDSTVVGGSRELIARVLSSGLEAAEVTAASDLSWEGDRINR